jgi:hypothetical protein
MGRSAGESLVQEVNKLLQILRKNSTNAVVQDFGCRDESLKKNKPEVTAFSTINYHCQL